MASWQVRPNASTSSSPSIPDRDARERLVSSFDLSITEQDLALGYRFDIVLRGPRPTPCEDHGK